MITKDDLANGISSRTGMDGTTARRVLNEMLSDIETELVNGGVVDIDNFGQILTKDYPEKTRRSSTGVDVRIDRSRVPYFEAAPKLNKKIRKAITE